VAVGAPTPPITFGTGHIDAVNRRYATILEATRVPVVLCTWTRVERLPRTLEMLADQDTPAVLYLWNNNRREAERIDGVLRRSPIPAQSVHCARNIGGFGRFYLARDLASVHDAVVFVDDDQDFGRSMITDQLASFAAGTLAGWWAFTYRRGATTYAQRDRVPSPFQPADYVGTGGMVADASIFTDPGLFTCPRRYWFVEDVWLSYYASHVRGWKLHRSCAELTFSPDGHDMDTTLWAAKAKMFRYLKRRGWRVG
jgi:hypothetical protein